jgi:outer membrane protein
MSRRWVSAVLGAVLMTGVLSAADMGIVNFKKAVEESKLGKQEQATFEKMRDQMASSLEKTQKELQELNSKMSDQEYMDGLSGTAQTDLRTKFQTLNTEMMQNQSQYYQILNQAQMRMIQGLMDEVQSASREVAKDKGLKVMMADDAVFYYVPEMDMTKQVVATMDSHFAPSTAESMGPTGAAAPTKGQGAPGAKNSSGNKSTKR